MNGRDENNQTAGAPELPTLATSAGTVYFYGEINHLSLSENSDLIQNLLRIENVNKLFPAGFNQFAISSDDGAEQHSEFRTQHALAVRFDHYDNLVCDIIDTRLESAIGRGSFGVIYPVIGTIKYRYDESSGYKFEDDQDKSVVKLGMENPDFGAGYTGVNYMSRIDEEFNRAATATHLRIREPLFGISLDHKLLSGLPMRKFKGKNLRALIDSGDKLSSADLFEITIKLFKKLHEQIHAKGIVHGDIKPENIVVHRDKYGWHVNIVDVNLAKSQGEHHVSFAGTLEYADEQALLGKVSVNSDGYAMHVTATQLWKNLAGLMPDELISQVTSILQQGIHIDSSTSGAFDATIEALEHTYVHSRYVQSDQRIHAEAGLRSGITARKTLQNVYYTQNCKSTESREQLIREMKSIIDALPDNECAVAEFVLALGANALHGIHAKNQLSPAIDHVFDKFDQNYQAIEKIYIELTEILQSAIDAEVPEQVKDTHQLEIYLQQLNAFCTRILDTTPTVLDDIVDATEHLHRKLMKVKNAKKHFSALLDTTMHEPLNNEQKPYKK